MVANKYVNVSILIVVYMSGCDVINIIFMLCYDMLNVCILLLVTLLRKIVSCRHDAETNDAPDYLSAKASFSK